MTCSACMGYQAEGPHDPNKGGTVELDGVKVTLVHAQHSSSSSRGAAGSAKWEITYTGEPCGLVFDFGGGPKIYFAGDTNVFGDMALIARLYAPDIAVLPIGGHYTMDPKRGGSGARATRGEAVWPVTRHLPDPRRDAGASCESSAPGVEVSPPSPAGRSSCEGAPVRLHRQPRARAGARGDVDLEGALVLDDVADDAALRAAHARGTPIVVRAATADEVRAALARPAPRPPSLHARRSASRACAARSAASSATCARTRAPSRSTVPSSASWPAAAVEPNQRSLTVPRVPPGEMTSTSGASARSSWGLLQHREGAVVRGHAALDPEELDGSLQIHSVVASDGERGNVRRVQARDQRHAPKTFVSPRDRSSAPRRSRRRGRRGNGVGDLPLPLRAGGASLTRRVLRVHEREVNRAALVRVVRALGGVAEEADQVTNLDRRHQPGHSNFFTR